MDSLTLHCLARELQRDLAGSRLDKVVQPSRDELLLRFWTGRERRELYLRIGIAGDTLFLATLRLAAPRQPPRFCQLLRARLRRLIAVSADPGERILRFDWLGSGGEGYQLVAELFGPQGNLLLLDAAGAIVDLWRRQPDGARRLEPRQPYRPPQPVQGEAVTLRTHLPPSPAIDHALKAAAVAGRDQQALLDFAGRWRAGEWAPCRVAWPGGSGLLPFPWEETAFAALTPVASISTALQRESVAGEEKGPAVANDLREQLRRSIAKHLGKLRKRLDRIRKDEELYRDPEREKQLGDLLLANLHLLRRGATSVTLDDWYSDPVQSVTIPLDQKLTPQQNAERCYRQYRKGVRAAGHLQRRRLETDREFEWLKNLELALDEVEGGDDLAQVQLELEQAGLLGRLPGKLARRPASNLEERLRRTLSPGGFQLIWGRNPAGNDLVSQRKTAANDLWFHAKDRPGCHLLLKRPGEGEVPEEDVLYAASLAAGYSRGRNDAKVEVIVAAGREIRKPKGVPAGLVTVGRHRTVVVAPQRLDVEAP